MSTADPSVLTCRFCSFYTPQGRRGGVCQQLGVPVQGNWQACSLSRHAFNAQTQAQQYDDILHLEPSFAIAHKTPIHPFPSPVAPSECPAA